MRYVCKVLRKMPGPNLLAIMTISEASFSRPSLWLGCSETVVDETPWPRMHGLGIQTAAGG